MAEVFALASGALSVAGFAGQLAQSAAFLHTFIKDIKDAPENVQHMREELQILTSILLSTEKSYRASNEDLRESLQYCGKRLDELLKIVKMINPAHSYSRRRLWSQVKVALKRSDLERFMAELGRCNLMLLMACNNIPRADQIAHANQTTSTLEHIRDLVVEQNNQKRHIESIIQQANESQAKQDSLLSGSGAIHATVQEIRQSTSNIQLTSGNISSTTQEIHSNLGKKNSELTRTSENVDIIRTMTERIESSQHTLMNEAFGNQTAFHKSINRTVSRSVRRHLQRHFGSSFVPSESGSHSINVTRDNVHPNLEPLTVTTALCHRTQGGNLTKQTPVSNRTGPISGWIKRSATNTLNVLTRNSVFGTTYVHTTTVIYTRANESGREETKQIHTTVISYLPPPWLTSRGTILRRQQLSARHAGNHDKLEWCLRTINVRDWSAEIFRACWDYDLHKVRMLFDCGLASPYDVDAKGTNLLYYAIEGFIGERYLQQIQGRREGFEILELLFDAGLDPGERNLDNDSSVGFASYFWAFSQFPELDFKSEELARKMIEHSKTDPFWGDEALLIVFFDNQIRILKWPGFSSMDVHGHNMPQDRLNQLLSSKQWALNWDRDQLNIFCGISSPKYGNSRNTFKIQIPHEVAFWVTSEAEGVERYLSKKLDVMKSFLAHGVLELGIKHSVESAVLTVINEGGNVLDLLSEGLDCGCFPDRKPWVRHRFKKLVLIETWMRETFRLLLSEWCIYVSDKTALDRCSGMARDKNARTACAWRKALRAFAQNPQNLQISGSFEVFSLKVKDLIAEDEEQDELGSSSGWETEHSDSEECDDSGWETEEELDDGRLLKPDKDRYPADKSNPDMKGKSRWKPPSLGSWSYSWSTVVIDWKNFDGEYWSHSWACPKKLASDTMEIELDQP